MCTGDKHSSLFFKTVGDEQKRFSDATARVKEAATDLRRERVRLISERVKQVSC
jgi:hypothetical protein